MLELEGVAVTQGAASEVPGGGRGGGGVAREQVERSRSPVWRGAGGVASELLESLFELDGGGRAPRTSWPQRSFLL